MALNTKVEEDFVSPLTAVRGSLEILRDFPKLSCEEQQRFIDTALRSCARLEKGIEELAKSVYSAGERSLSTTLEEAEPEDDGPSFESRIHLLEDLDCVEIDLTGLVFSNTKIVNDFYDVVERLVTATGRSWYFLVNYGDCTVWPEAWVAFAHRGKKINVGYSLGTVRYANNEDANGGQFDASDPNAVGSRDAALARIQEMKAAESSKR